MNGTVFTATENPYYDFEMESKENTPTRIYDYVARESVVPVKNRKTTGKQREEKNGRLPSTPAEHSCGHSDGAVVQRLLCIVTVVVVVAFVTATATLILAFMMIMSQNVLTTDCATVQGAESPSPSVGYSQLWKNLQDLEHNITSLREMLMTNISKTQILRGPPGYNGTQGPPGVSGPPGPRGYNGTQGPPGASKSSGLSNCSHKQEKSSLSSSGPSAYTDVTITEPNGKKFLGVNCETNDAKIVTLNSIVVSNGKRKYICACEGTLDSRVNKTMHCIVHYWECPT